jgi:hypothetical protein
VRYAKLEKISDAEKRAPIGTMLRNHLLVFSRESALFAFVTDERPRSPPHCAQRPRTDPNSSAAGQVHRGDA